MGFMSGEFPGHIKKNLFHFLVTLFEQNGKGQIMLEYAPAIRNAICMSLITLWLTTSMYLTAFIIPEQE